jgi:hypothetical protein
MNQERTKEQRGDFENYLKKMGIRSWIKVAKDRDAWKFILKEARVLHGPKSRSRERERELVIGKCIS